MAVGARWGSEAARTTQAPPKPETVNHEPLSRRALVVRTLVVICVEGFRFEPRGNNFSLAVGERGSAYSPGNRHPPPRTVSLVFRPYICLRTGTAHRYCAGTPETRNPTPETRNRIRRLAKLLFDSTLLFSDVFAGAGGGRVGGVRDDSRGRDGRVRPLGPGTLHPTPEPRNPKPSTQTHKQDVDLRA